MDRFLDGKDATSSDFVRLEYEISLQGANGWRPNIIPVFTENFVFPTIERVPESVRAVFSANPVRWAAEHKKNSIEALVKRVNEGKEAHAKMGGASGFAAMVGGGSMGSSVGGGGRK